MLHREIIRYDGTDNDYVSKFKYTLLSKKIEHVFQMMMNLLVILPNDKFI